MEHETFKGFNDSNRLLDRCQYFKMIDGKKISAMFSTSWKKSFNNGIGIPAKMRFCNECSKEKYCDRCYNQVNEIKDFEANLILLKRQARNQFSHMLPFSKV